MYIFLALILVITLIGRTETFAMRYDQDKVIRLLSDTLGYTAFFARDSSREDGLHYLQLGDDPEKPYLVFVHGSPGSLWAYEPYLRDSSLLSGANMISVDRYGLGYSQFGTAEPSLEKQAEGVMSILRQLPQQPMILIGHSYGGPVILQAAMDEPDLISGVIMIAPSISPEHEPSNGWRKVVDFFLWRWVLPPSLKVSNQEILPLKKELEKSIHKWDSIKAAITVIQGMEDQLVPMENAMFAEDMVPEGIPFKKVMLENENHFILWTRTEVIKEEIYQMLNN